MAWRVGAQEPPPQAVMTGFQNDIVITPFVASSKTQKQLRTAPSTNGGPKSNLDPWQDSAQDPWATYQPSRGNPSAATEGKNRLTALQEQLRTDLRNDMDQRFESRAQAAVQAAAASSSGASGQQEHRLQALEVQELQGQNAQFNTWFQQAGERLKATESTMGAMQQTLNTHQREIHALGSTFQTTMKNVKDDLSTEMNESFNKQLSRLEALLEKKQRTD
eukprot:s627_g46.t1